MKITTVLLWQALSHFTLITAAVSPTATLKDGGKVIGTTVTSSTDPLITYERFQGIPYATAQRFGPPQPPIESAVVECVLKCS